MRVPDLALLMALAGCLTAQDPIRIVAFGDSTTARRKTIEQVWADRLPGLLADDDVPALVVNAGVAGDTIEQARARLERDVLRYRPDLVILQFGLNDAAIDVAAGKWTPRVTQPRYELVLRRLLRELAARRIPAIVMTPNPLLWTEQLEARYGRPPYDTTDRWGLDFLNMRYAASVRRIARDLCVPLVDPHRAFRLFDRQANRRADDLLLDGMHPNDAGHRTIARLLAGRIRALVRSGRVRPSRAAQPAIASCKTIRFVAHGRPERVHDATSAWKPAGSWLVGSGRGNPLIATHAVDEGDFRIAARLVITELDGTAAAFALGESHFGFDGRGRTLFTQGPLFGDRVTMLAPNARWIAARKPFTFEVVRAAGRIRFVIDGKTVHAVVHRGRIGSIGFLPRGGTLQIDEFSARGSLRATPRPMPDSYTIPIVDLTQDKHRQVVVDREVDQYLGHPTTVLLEDNKTMFCVYPKGHGRGAIVMKKSTDAGLTWGARLSLPANWRTSKETPTIHRVVDREGNRRLILFSGLFPIRLAVSEDDGESWTPLRPIGDFGGIVAMSSVERLENGDYAAFFHDDGRFLRGSGKRSKFFVYQTISRDGGLSWGQPERIATHASAQLCEPGCIRSPDGNEICLLLRENSRRHNSFAIFSQDEGKTWSEPRELPAALTGDRHQGVYAPDGRLFASFRDTTRVSATKGDWVGWVGTWEDIKQGREGQYRVRLMDNHVRADCAYPALELLPDGTIVATTYGHWIKGEKPYIVSVRFKLRELDQQLARMQALGTKEAVSLGRPFGDHMVLQQGKPLPIWGRAEPGQKVTVTLGDEKRITTAGRRGRWRVTFGPRKASRKPVSLVAEGGNEIRIHDILVGEVWLCAGQSNMAFALERCASAKQAVPGARDPLLRLFHLRGAPWPAERVFRPQEIARCSRARYFSGEWTVCTPATARAFSGVAYFFGKRIAGKLQVPVGLVVNAVDGSPTEAWIGRDALTQEPELAAMLDDWLRNDRCQPWCRERASLNLRHAEGHPQHPFQPTFLFDAGIVPLAPLAMRGVIWYQGESNGQNPRQHEKLLRLLIRNWRKHFAQGEFPFLFVQLPNMSTKEGYPSGSWPEFRQGQLEVLRTVPNTGMAVTIDIGDSLDVHPKNKRDVGDRLARWALATAYADRRVVCSGPLFRSVEQRDGLLVVEFDHAGGLVARGGELRGFEIAGEDRRFVRARATITGDTVEVSSPEVRAPVAVRYAWAPDPGASLYNAAGLPASPFRAQVKIE